MLNPTIILVRPQLGENIGMVARAMLNFGLTDLRLVTPRDGWPSEKAVATASGATDILDQVKLYETTKEAVADLHRVYATTARDRDMVKLLHTPASASEEMVTLSQENPDLKLGILFGAERTGLQNEEVALAEAMITYPTNPEFSSLNLAQAVLLMGYALYSHQFNIEDKQPRVRKGATPFATKDEIDNFLDRLYNTLEEKNFFKTEEMKPVMKQNLETLFTRGQLTQQEVNTLHGLIKALQK